MVSVRLLVFTLLIGLCAGAFRGIASAEGVLMPDVATGSISSDGQR